ncbi:MAG: RraA family protein [Betaproteobacteria bacterium]|nr:RraA family protein [Betaproteobacteria bacterium]MDH5349998.1 RraA family protein [Betaproteobacteria bacterium]
MNSEKPLTGKIPRERIGVLELPGLPVELLAAFRALEDLSGVVSDALDELGIAGAIPSSVLRPTDPAARLCGPALTALNRPLDIAVAQAAKANVSRLGEIEAHNLAQAGDVLVIQGVEGISSMGAISASIGRRQGEGGAVVDGAVRDIGHSRRIGYPVWSKGASPITGKWRIETVAINVPVSICGVAVKPGDLVVADEVGVCFVPRERVADVLAVVQRILQYEEKRMAQIAAGTPVPDLARAPRK